LERHLDGVSGEIVSQFDVSLIWRAIAKEDDAEPSRLENEGGLRALAVPPDFYLTRPVVIADTYSTTYHTRPAASAAGADPQVENRRSMDMAFASHRCSNSTIPTFFKAIGFISNGSLRQAPSLGAGGGGQCCPIGFASEKLAGRALAQRIAMLHGDVPNPGMTDLGAGGGRLHYHDRLRRRVGLVLISDAAKLDAEFVGQGAAKTYRLRATDRLDVAAGAPGNRLPVVVGAGQDAGKTMAANMLGQCPGRDRIRRHGGRFQLQSVHSFPPPAEADEAKLSGTTEFDGQENRTLSRTGARHGLDESGLHRFGLGEAQTGTNLRAVSPDPVRGAMSRPAARTFTLASMSISSSEPTGAPLLISSSRCTHTVTHEFQPYSEMSPKGVYP
jgi:hypothetical protein